MQSSGCQESCDFCCTLPCPGGCRPLAILEKMPYFRFQYCYFDGVGPDTGGLASNFRVVWKTIHGSHMLQACVCHVGSRSFYSPHAFARSSSAVSAKREVYHNPRFISHATYREAFFFTLCPPWNLAMRANTPEVGRMSKECN